jgi:general secretion pathway protein H
MLRRNQRSNSRGGFTLAELIVVLVILGIAAAMIIPNAVSGRDVHATAAARVLGADLEYAQSYAITHQVPVTVTFDTINETYTLSSQSGTLVHPITKSSYVVTVGDDASGADLASADFAGELSITFDELGAPDNAGSVAVQSGTRGYLVQVSPATGKVTITMMGS